MGRDPVGPRRPAGRAGGAAALSGGQPTRRRKPAAPKGAAGQSRPSVATAWIDLCALDEVGINTSLRVDRAHPQGLLEVAVHRLPDGVYVTDDHCTHQPVSLAQGFIEDGIVYCPFHGGAFDARTGAPARRPCTEPLRTYSVRVEDGRVLVDPEPRIAMAAPAKPAGRG